MSSNPNNKNEWIEEYHKDTRFGLKGKILVEENTPYQKITIVDTKHYGKGLLLDDCWMTTEKQEKTYHECLIHPALSSSHQIRKILIIGGGDGGSARECLKYKDVKEIDLVEIDSRVIELSQKFLPTIGGNAWKDSRLNIRIKNGIDWVKNSEANTYDIIIIDSSDPFGPAEELFTKKFFKECQRILKPSGIFATQSESPEAFFQDHINLIKNLRNVFDFADPIYGWVPIYPSGWWSWTFASMNSPQYMTPNRNRTKEISKYCQIWSIKWHENSFKAIPAFIDRHLNQ